MRRSLILCAAWTLLLALTTPALAGQISVHPLGRGNFVPPLDPMQMMAPGSGWRQVEITDSVGNKLVPWDHCPQTWSAYDDSAGNFQLENFPEFYLRKGDKIHTYYFNVFTGQKIFGPFIVTAIADDGAVTAGN